MLTFETVTQIRFMESRAYELDVIMQEVRCDIDISIEKYGRIIDYENTYQSAKLNDIMTFFTLFSISCLPASILGGIFGMNVRVPFQADDQSSLYPFLFLIVTIFIMTIGVFFLFKYALIKRKR